MGEKWSQRVLDAFAAEGIEYLPYLPIGSLAMAQRIPMLMLVTERGGLGETVATQIPFGAAARRVLDAIGIPCFELRR